jgi:hypothetical protein
MNNYDDFKRDSFKTCVATTMIIDLQTEDNKIIYIVFNPLESDQEHALMAEVFTVYKDYGSPELQFGSPCNYGVELAVREMVIGNYLNNNLFWEERVDDEDYEETASLYDGDLLDDKEIVKIIKEAADDYENGAILEAHDKLLAVVDAIAEFNNDYSED